MFAQMLKSLRKSKGLTQVEFAKLMDVSQQTIGSWETSRTEPSIEMLIKLADFFNVTIDELVDRTMRVIVFREPHRENVNMVGVSDEEYLFMEKRRALDERGRKNLNALLEIEYRNIIGAGEYETETLAAHSADEKKGHLTARNLREIEEAEALARRKYGRE